MSTAHSRTIKNLTKLPVTVCSSLRTNIQKLNIKQKQVDGNIFFSGKSKFVPPKKFSLKPLIIPLAILLILIQCN